MRAHVPRLEIGPLSDYRTEHIMVSRLSDYLEKHRNLVFPHRHNFYHLVFFTAGGGYHAIDFHRFEVEPYQIYFMVPGQIHTWEFEGEMEGFVINFSDDFFHSFLLRPDYLDAFSFFDGESHHAVLRLHDKVIGEVSDLFGQLTRLHLPGTPLTRDLARVILLHIFLVISDSIPAEDFAKRSQQKHRIVQAFQKLVEKNFTRLKLPGEYAPLLHVTTNHLNALCKEHLGIQAGQVIRNRLILEAKRLLASADYSVAQIAYQLNFSDNSYFTKFFKKETGLTPEGFRKG
jgi:AraC family transcriptional regulator, transcriptional activator of pobA